ncbi:MAG: flagellar basal body rod protein FlgC [Desulfuromonadales bacterium C00003093]|nr:MAG: flagellar basal body rod protein FlgC [Desulfuromonadales bacterium C00003093]
MNLLNAIKISSTGLSAERVRLNVASMNLANAHVTRTLDGGPYKARSVIFSSVPFTNPESELGELENDGFAKQLARALQTVKVSKIVEDSGPFKEIHDPSHPDADEQGMVLLPNVNVMEQMVDIMTAARAFEANITAIDTAKSMAMKAIEIAR